MAPPSDSAPSGARQRSLRLPLLLGHLLIALCLGGAAAWLVQQQLVSPLADSASALQREREAHVLDWIEQELANTRNLALAFSTLTRSHWGDDQRLRRVVPELLAQVPAGSAIVAAGIWPEPRALNRKELRHSLYWTVDAGQVSPHDDYNDPERISYFGEIWYAPLRWNQGASCHFTRRYQEPFLRRPVIACATPLIINDQFQGVTTLVIDPARWQIEGPWQEPASSRPDAAFFLLLDDEQQVLRAAGVDAVQAKDNLPSLGQRDSRFGPLAVRLHELSEARTRAARDGDPAWDGTLQDLRKATRELSERQAAQLLGRLRATSDAGSRQALRVQDSHGQSRVVLRSLPGFGALVLGARAAPATAGLTPPQLSALAATAGALTLALLLVYGLSLRLLIAPLRRLVEQLERPAEDTLLESRGAGELAALTAFLNQRHERIRQLLNSGARADGGRLRGKAAGAGTGRDAGEWRILDGFPDAIVLADGDGRVQYLNAAAEALSGWTLDTARELDFDEIFHISDRRGKKRMTGLPARAFAAARPSERPLAVQFTTRSGHHLPLSISSGPVFGDSRGSPSGVLMMLHDNRQDSRAAGAAARSAEKDPLTGMLNRQSFDVELAARCDATRMGGQADFHLIYLDVDKLGRINSAYGTDAGDELLRQLARLIQSDVGDGSPVYRLHSDKFGVMLETDDAAQAQVTAELLRADAQSWGFHWEGERHEITVSIALLKVDRESGRPVDVLRSAAELCQKAQLEGGGKVLVGQARGQAREGRDDRHWLNHIKRGLAENLFHLSTQQIRPMQREMEAAGEVFDTLLQLEDDEGFWTGSDVFMPVAERHQMGTQLDRWTFERIFGKLQQDDELYEKIDFCLVTVSVNSMQNMSFLDFLMEKFQDSGIARSKICIDLYEEDIQSRLSAAREFCQALSRAGCRLSLSGISTQPSSFKLVREMPVQLVRFDPLITRNAAKDPVDRLATESLHRIVRAMDKKSMATRVDTPELLRVIQGIGIDYAQGDAVARATPMLFQAQV